MSCPVNTRTRITPTTSSEVGEAYARVDAVAAVHRDEVGRHRLDLVRVAQPTGVDTAHPGDARGERLRAKLGPDGAMAASEAERMVHRVVDKLLHTPTVRVRELVDAPAESMSDALRLLFDLGPGDAIDLPLEREHATV